MRSPGAAPRGGPLAFRTAVRAVGAAAFLSRKANGLCQFPHYKYPCAGHLPFSQGQL